MKENKDYTTFASIVNRECEKFKLSEIIPDMIKCLIFLQGRTAPKDAEIISRLPTKLKKDQEIIFQNLADFKFKNRHNENCGTRHFPYSSSPE